MPCYDYSATVVTENVCLYLNFTFEVQYRHNISKSYLFSSRLAVLILLWLRMGAAAVDAALLHGQRVGVVHQEAAQRLQGLVHAARDVSGRGTLLAATATTITTTTTTSRWHAHGKGASHSVLAFFLTTLPTSGGAASTCSSSALWCEG